MASGALLQEIQAGRALKKAQTRDRSAPIIDDKPSSGGGGVGARAGGGSSGAAATAMGGGPPQLAGLFAGGMPKLKPAGQSGLGTSYLRYIYGDLILHYSEASFAWEAAFNPQARWCSDDSSRTSST